MNGRFVMDTNAVIALLKGNDFLNNSLRQAVWIGLPVIAELEFLSFPNLSDSDSLLFTQFKGRVDVLGLDAADQQLINQIIRIRKEYSIKLPDAIIAGTSIHCHSTLLSNDGVFKQIKELSL